MTISFGTGIIEVTTLWPELKAQALARSAPIQYAETTDDYKIFILDDRLAYVTTIFKGTVPPAADVSQVDNDTYKEDFEDNYQANANQPQGVANRTIGTPGSPSAEILTIQGAPGSTAIPVFTEVGTELTVETSQLPAALVGGRLDANVGAWLGSTAPTVGQKTSAASIPVVVASDQSALAVAGAKSNNTAVPGATNLGTLPAVATALDPTYSEGNQVALSTDLSGALRISGSIVASNPSVGPTGDPVPAEATLVGGSDGSDLRALQTLADGRLVVTNAGDPFPVIGTQDDGDGVLPGEKAVLVAGTDGVDPFFLRTNSDGVLAVTDAGTPLGVTGRSVDGAALPGSPQGLLVSGTDGVDTHIIRTHTDGVLAVAGAKSNDGTPAGNTNLGTLPAVATAAAPTYTEGNQVALSTDLTGAVRISGSITASNPSVGDNGDPVPAASTQIGGSDGTNLQAARVFDADSGGGTQYVLGAVLRKSASGGSVEAGTSADPLRVDPTGTTAQPVTDNGGSLTVDGTVTANQGTAAATAGAWPTKVTDGTNVAAVKAASTAAVAADPALVVAVSPNNTVKVSELGVPDPNNSTSTPLLAAGVFTGTYTDCRLYKSVLLLVRSETPDNGLEIRIYWASDSGGTNESIDPGQAYTVVTGDDSWHRFAFNVQGTFFKIELTNESTGTQTVLDVLAFLSTQLDTTSAAGEETGLLTNGSLPRSQVIGAVDTSTGLVTPLSSSAGGLLVNVEAGASVYDVNSLPFTIPGQATYVGGFAQGTGIVRPFPLYDTDSGAGSEFVLGTTLRASKDGGSVEAGTQSDPLGAVINSDRRILLENTALSGLGETGVVRGFGLGMIRIAALWTGTLTDDPEVTFIVHELDPADLTTSIRQIEVTSGSPWLPLVPPAQFNVAYNLVFSDAFKIEWSVANGSLDDGVYLTVVTAPALASESGFGTDVEPYAAMQVGGKTVNDGNYRAAKLWNVNTDGPGPQEEPVFGVNLRLSGAGGSTEFGTATSPIRVNPTGTTAQPVTDNGGSLTVDTTQLPAALVGGRLDANVGAWLGSTAPTVGQKAMASSLPVTVASDQSPIFNGLRDTNNSTSTPLGDGATFTGTRTSCLGYSLITVYAIADCNSATDGIRIYWSADGAGTDEEVDDEQEFTYGVDVIVNRWRSYSFQVKGPFFKIEYENVTGSPQTVFDLVTVLQTVAAGTGSDGATSVVGTKAVGDFGWPLEENLGVLPAMASDVSLGLTQGMMTPLVTDLTGTLRVTGFIRDANNSTSTPLIAGGSFAGNWTNCEAYGSITLYINSDEDSDSGGITVSWAADGAGLNSSPNQYSGTYIANAGATGWRRYQFVPTAPYYIVQYFNNVSSAQTYFHLVAVLSPKATPLVEAGEVFGTGTSLGQVQVIGGVRDTFLDVTPLALDSQGDVKVSNRSGTAALSNVASSATSVTLLAANTARKGATIQNDSTQILLVKFGTTASSTSYTVRMVADAYYEVPYGYTGRIDGIWASANGSARITEIT